jgi:trans-aconitate 2-methyltransferase
VRYDAAGGFVWELGSSLIELLGPERGERILDVGCGTGHLAARIAEAGAEVLGIDASSSMIEQARKNYPRLRFEVVDVLEMDGRSEHDAVFSNAVLHWVTRPELAATRIFDTLKPGGRFVAELGGEGNISMIVAAVGRAREEIGFPGMRTDAWYFPGLDEYSSLLESVGFVIGSAELFPRPTPLGMGEGGLGGWLDIFAEPLMEGLSGPRRKAVVSAVEEMLRPSMFRDGTWWGDYVRIRVRALKT